MRINIALVLSVLSVLSSFCGAQQVTTELTYDELEHDEGNCTEQNLNCIEDDVEGRKKRPGGGVQTQNVVVGHGSGGHDSVEYYHEDEGVDDVQYVRKKKKGGRKKGRKKNKVGKIHYKKLQPYIYAFIGMKLLLYKLLLKKFAFLSVASFFMSKISFVLASLVALKQFFNQPSHHRSSDSNKLEVVHIPIRKEKKTHKYYPENDWEESRFVPITFAPDQIYDTTPYYNYNINNQQDFHNDSQEDEDDGNRNTNEIYPDNHQKPYQTYQSYDNKNSNNKNFYQNHANAGFL